MTYKWRSLRRPKTTQEKRENSKVALTFDEHCVKIRPRRNPNHLVDAWDDFWIREQKSWKNLRKTQYKTDKDSTPFSFVEKEELFKIGGRLYRRISAWDYELPYWLINAIEVETGKTIEVDYHHLVEYPIK